MLKNKKILIGVTGGIAIYKVLDLISKLKKLDAEVRVIMTESAQKLVSKTIFETLSREKAYTDTFELIDSSKVTHIELARWADYFLIAPASANTISKLSYGLADNLLTTTLLAFNRYEDLFIAPTMNTQMLINPATQENLRKLVDRGVNLIQTNSGFLACNEYGEGRMAEPNEIIDFLDMHSYNKDLLGKKILVTAGPTIEKLDPVRYISNFSSGKMGYAIAKAARDRGAEVTLISSNVKLKDIEYVKTIKTSTFSELKFAIEENFDSTDYLIMASAPSDFKVKNFSETKIKKINGYNFKFEENEDLIKYFASKKTNQKVIGFAAETNDLLTNAKKKLINKKLDMIVANDVSKEGAGFNTETNIITIIKNDYIENLEKDTKYNLAHKILDRI
ncbi:bifunctional phosphopantothenoylcysteine decarboxylase/phosphopantothenate--cysteine ligase CoaBC [Citroniella saccharovorans]|uniref:Coenzyme A biosynthesis bifunctional protein CoaBC n=1 Tax=Citroniella saccharovorans TaxID=2053367 RepID=A0AAW9MU27_9FIRM|nr:bifunctional phosphopantothenoylcysteine decarboxylase/phosphopantothenate--cysteine ligase CoaBC [Citroniella saccharovorans]MEB3429505.1 bifunctional phosphopantothenoylcysteine decarboxylase/phosphopantothenate--cysteine ligase CoaBC [Citroniella saccharovorans]